MTNASHEIHDGGQRQALQCELAAETLRSFGTLRLRVRGQSMLPSIWPGDTLVIKHSNFADIAPGDIVLYSRGNRFFAHRVLRGIEVADNPQLITQGDALRKQDAPVSPVELLGRVSQIIRDGKGMRVSPKGTLATWCVGRIFCNSPFLSRLLVHLRTKRANSHSYEVPCHT